MDTKREIKFRYWNGKKMLYKDTDDGDSKNETWDTYWGTFNSMLELLDDKKLMQYTGLKDKNGKEIYERDIIRDQFDNLIIVEMKPFYYTDTEGNCAGFGFCLENHSLDEFKYGVEVLGNIYENSNLLNKQK